MLDPALLPLTDGRLRLRPLLPQDATAYAEGTTDPDVRAYAHLPEPHYTPESVVALSEGAVLEGLARGDLAVLTIAGSQSDQFGGSLVIFDVTEETAEVEAPFTFLLCGRKRAARGHRRHRRARAIPVETTVDDLIDSYWQSQVPPSSSATA